MTLEIVNQPLLRTLSVFLLSHNRPETAIEAAKSILKQSSTRFRFIISDNSESGKAQDQVEDFCLLENIEFRKRGPKTTAFDHFWSCVGECETDYLMLFHDDDLMLPNFIEDFWESETLTNDCSAVGFNAIVENVDHSTTKSFVSRRTILGPLSASDLVDNYFLKFSPGIAPFPSYVFLSSALKRPERSIGKYGDVALLFRLATEGKVCWVNKEVMIYRFHGGNDGLSESLTDRLRLLAFMKQNSSWFSRFNLSTYRYFLYCKIYRTRLGGTNKRIKQFIKRYRFSRITSLSYWHNLTHRLVFS